MALQKEKTLPCGSVGNYWRITRSQVDRVSSEVTLVLSLYKSAEDRQAGKTPMHCHKQFKFQYSPEELAGDIIAAGYTKISSFVSSRVPNFNGVGTHVGDADLDGAQSV